MVSRFVKNKSAANSPKTGRALEFILNSAPSNTGTRQVPLDYLCKPYSLCLVNSRYILATKSLWSDDLHGQTTAVPILAVATLPIVSLTLGSPCFQSCQEAEDVDRQPIVL